VHVFPFDKTKAEMGIEYIDSLHERIGISESAVSHQLRLMRSMRIVRGRREGRCVYYTVDDQHVLDLFQQGLRHVSEERR